MKPRLRWKWLPLSARPDPVHGLPIPRSAHGLSFFQPRNSFLIYGGASHSGRPIPANQHSWECYLGDATFPSTTVTPQSYPSARTLDHPQWRHIDFGATNPAANLPPVRIGPAQTVDADRYLYIFGGRDGKGTELNDLWRLDTEDWSWAPLVADGAPSPRAQATLLYGEASLYLHGGTNAQYGALTDWYRFDLQQQIWHALGEAPRRGKHLVSVPGTSRWIVAPQEGRDGSRGAIAGGVSAVWPSSGVVMRFGGSVAAEDAATNDLVLWEIATGRRLARVTAPPTSDPWPEARIGAAADGWEDPQGMGHWFLWGGRSGEQQSQPLQDVWKLEIYKVC